MIVRGKVAHRDALEGAEIVSIGKVIGDAIGTAIAKARPTKAQKVARLRGRAERLRWRAHSANIAGRYKRASRLLAKCGMLHRQADAIEGMP